MQLMEYLRHRPHLSIYNPNRPLSAVTVPKSVGASSAAFSSTKLSGQLSELNISGDPALKDTTSSIGAKQTFCKGWGTILDTDLLVQVNSRPHSARETLGDTAVVEARKGLSRVLRPRDDADLELFATQLKNTDASACEPDFRGIKDKVVCFAMSYVHTKKPVGRFKFTSEQWGNFKAACAEISGSGVQEMRVWLDQCLWLRDASQGAWAHTGLMPYVLWPVISLGVKSAGGERTLVTFDRMWPFVEEVAGLWSMGVIITSELRGSTVDSGHRRWLSFQLRRRCEPEMSMMLILLNIFHGAVDDLHTGWKEDVEELKEMAKWNLVCANENVIVGSDWRSRIANLPVKSIHTMVPSLRLPYADLHYNGTPRGSVNMYLDGSCKFEKEEGWDGMKEWLSGNEVAVAQTDRTSSAYDRVMAKKFTQVQIFTDVGEFQILGSGKCGYALWLLVAMDGLSSRFSRGHVAWTKVMHGLSSCSLEHALMGGKTHVVENVLKEQLGKKVRITSMTSRDNEPIQWT